MPKTDKYFRAACGVHVLKCAYVIGLFGALFETLSLLYMFLCSFLDGSPPWYHYILNLISLISYMTLMTAVKNECSWLFWPFLIANTLCIFLDMVLIIALLTYRSELLQHQHKEVSKPDEEKIAIQSLVYAIFVSLSAVLNIYFIRIVWRAKRYVQNEHISSSVYHLTGSQPYEPSKWGVRAESEPLNVP